MPRRTPPSLLAQKSRSRAAYSYLPTTSLTTCPSFLSRPYRQRILRCRRRRAKRRSDFLPAFGSALGAAGSASDSISIRWRPDRHAREPSNGTQRCSGRDPLVPMMEPTDPGNRHNLSGTAGLNRSPLGGVLAQRKMRSGSVVVFEVRNKDPSQMSFIQDDHMVQAFAPHAADQAFRIRILPRASWRRDDLLHADRHHGRAERLPVCAVPVADQIPRRRVPRKGLAYLLCHPTAVGCAVTPKCSMRRRL